MVLIAFLSYRVKRKYDKAELEFRATMKKTVKILETLTALYFKYN